MDQAFFLALVEGVVREVVLHGPFTKEELEAERVADARPRLGNPTCNDCPTCAGIAHVDVVDAVTGSVETQICSTCVGREP